MTSRRRDYEDVWHGVKARTSGGLTKSDLTINKLGRIVSKARSEHGKRMFKKNNLSKYWRQSSTTDKKKKKKKRRKRKKTQDCDC